MSPISLPGGFYFRKPLAERPQASDPEEDGPRLLQGPQRLGLQRPRRDSRRQGKPKDRREFCRRLPHGRRSGESVADALRRGLPGDEPEPSFEPRPLSFCQLKFSLHN